MIYLQKFKSQMYTPSIALLKNCFLISPPRISYGFDSVDFVEEQNL